MHKTKKRIAIVNWKEDIDTFENLVNQTCAEIEEDKGVVLSIKVNGFNQQLQAVIVYAV